MTYLDFLPERVGNLIRSRFVCEWATISGAGVPINSPLVPFSSADLATIDAATGLAYPAKAERARRNPKLGMLFEGADDEPVVSISAIATIRDSDFQANLLRYLSEEILTPMLDPEVVDYRDVTRQAIWYFTRIIICAKPVVVRWWDDRAATDGAPHEWRAPAATIFEPSDPPPPGSMSKAPWRDNPPEWRAIAQGALGRAAPGHLTLIDDEGFPLPIRTRRIELADDGFRIALPGWLPWREGKATLSFEGVEVFVGDVETDGGTARMVVERALPVLPLMADPGEILRPSPATRDALLARIDQELARRGRQRPIMPDHPPEPTAGARFRAEAAFGFSGLAGI